MKVNSPSTAMAGRAAGSTTCQKMPEHASTVDPRGLDELVGHGVDEVLPHEEHAERGDQPRHDHRPRGCRSSRAWPSAMNSGTTPSWVGHRHGDDDEESSAVAPRNRSLAKAKPASVEKKTTDVAATVDDHDAVDQRLPERHGVERPAAAFSRSARRAAAAAASRVDRLVGVRADQERPVERQRRDRAMNDGQQAVDEERRTPRHGGRMPPVAVATWPSACRTAREQE